MRLHIATLNGCRTCASARLAPEAVSEREAQGALGNETEALSTLSEPEDRPGLRRAHGAGSSLDHRSDVRRWRDTFGDDGFIELSMMTTQYIGFGRVLAILQLETVACPI